MEAVSGWGIDGVGMKKQPGSRVVFGLKIIFLLLASHPLTLLLIGRRGFEGEDLWAIIWTSI